MKVIESPQWKRFIGLGLSIFILFIGSVGLSGCSAGEEVEQEGLEQEEGLEEEGLGEEEGLEEEELEEDDDDDDDDDD